MKISVALFVVICIVGVYSHPHGEHGHKLTPEQIARIMADVEECARTNDIGHEVFEDLKAGKNPTPSRNLSCFSACVLKRNGVMNADGSTNHKPTDSDVAKECKDLRGDDDCETAGKIVSCLHKNNLILKISE
uniref:Odorant-binding protein 14 n=1 Tax=Chouioia cunea TaxID=1570515 RepID=A0A6B9CRP8_9HYME|nr:odorant-binding protein 14 [Chouioia cunea]